MKGIHVFEPTQSEVNAFRKATGMSFSLDGQFIAAKSNGKVVSVLEYSVDGTDYPSVLSLDSAATLEGFRRKGIVRMLVDELIDGYYNEGLEIDAPMIISHDGAGLVAYAKKKLEQMKKEKNACE